MTQTESMNARSDDELVALSAQGDKQAYSSIVERYQNLVCSIAYSRCGDRVQSEDLAQETFLVAWRELGALQDASRLRSWLSGIARNLTSNHVRASGRESANAHLADGVAEDLTSTDASPDDELIAKEQDALIWNAIERIPETYRTTLVLYYRQDRSVQQVAEALEISTDAVKQRLARGRSLLRERIERVVEDGLSESRPRRAFTLATIAALPALSAQVSAAAVATASLKGPAAAKSATSAGLASGAALGAAAGVLGGVSGGYVGARAAVASARSPRERALLKRMLKWAAGLSILFAISITLLLVYRSEITAFSPGLYTSLLVGLVVLHVATIGVGSWIVHRRSERVHREDRERGDLFPHAMPAGDRPGRDWRSEATLLGLPLVHVSFGGIKDGKPARGRAKGWIAIGDIAFGVVLGVGGFATGLFALGGIALGGVALAGLAAGGLAIGGGAIGWLAVGGVAVAVASAAGGLAVAWSTAVGGMAIASDFAVGGLAIAQEANTELARQHTSGGFHEIALRLLKAPSWIVIPCVLPVLVIQGVQLKRRGRGDRATSA